MLLGIDVEILINLGIILVLLMLSAFFSGSETALTAASRARIQFLAQRGNRRADKVQHLTADKDRLIGGILLGNNLVNILASALATHLLTQIFGEAGVAYATMVMTCLVLIFAEVLPKTYAIYNSERMALFVSPILEVVILIFAPIVHTVQVVVRGTFHLFGTDVSGNINVKEHEEELRGAIELHGKVGEEEEHERAMMRSILDLSDVSVSEIMTHRKNAVMIDANQEPRAIVAQVLGSPYTRIPLWQGEKDNIVGVLHAKALLRALHEDGKDMDSLDVLAVAGRPYFIPDTTTLLDQLHAFRQRHEHFALVVDEYGALMGIVTLEDILEEIVGDISDEHDIAVPGVRRQPDKSLVVVGTVTIRDLNREFGWTLPDDEAATIAGLVLHEARVIPMPGQRFVFYGFEFEILRRQRHQITLLRIRPPAEPSRKGEKEGESPAG